MLTLKSKYWYANEPDSKIETPKHVDKAVYE
jgi:hypothetical protein